MSIGLMGKKMGMTQAFDEDGRRVTLTVIKAGPCVITQKKVSGKDGYNALQVGFGEIEERKVNKPRAGHFAKAGKGLFKYLSEFGVEDPGKYELGQELTLELFKKGDSLDVVGRSKGKGFQGTVKRHHFTRGPMSHGTKNMRPPGSIGSSAWPSHVIKGKRMPGHMGDRKVTIQNLTIWDLDTEKHLLFLEGAVPGANQGLLIIRPSVKAKKAVE